MQVAQIPGSARHSGYLELTEILGSPTSNMGTKMNTATKFMRTTSIACSIDIQKQATESLRDGDLQTFTDLMNTKEVEDFRDDPHFWVNKGKQENDGLNIGELCVSMNSRDGLSVLVRLGVPMDLVNTVSGMSPLHRAAEEGKPNMLSLILKTPRHNFDVNSPSSKRKRGLTALHLCASQQSADHLACLNILLGHQIMEVDARDSSWSITPLYMAGKAKNKDAVVRLIEEGANIDLIVGNTGKSVKEFLATWMPDLQTDRIRVKKVPNKVENVKEKLMEIVGATHLYSKDYFTQFLQFRRVCIGLSNAQQGYEELVERICRKGLADFADILFKKGADPNKFPHNSFSFPIIDAAERGDFALLQVLKKHETNWHVEKIQTHETILHCVMKSATSGNEEKYKKCISLLLTDSDLDFQETMQNIINKSDVNGNTALHYSTEKWPEYITRLLLQSGANIGIKNQWGESPISRIPPDLMESFLNEDCLSGGTHDIFHKEFEVTFRYDFLAPDPASLPESYKPHTPLEECQPLSPENDKSLKKTVGGSGFHPKATTVAMPETESLWYMGQSKEHRHLLKHPVITSFLWFKWERIRPYFNRNLRIYLLFVFLLTWEIFVKYGGVSQKENIKEVFNGLYIGIFTFILCLIGRDWSKDVQESIRAEQLSKSESNSIQADINLHSPKMIIQIISSNWVDLLMIAGMSMIFLLNIDGLQIPIIVLICILLVREIIQMAVSLKRYFSSVENWFEMLMISLALTITIRDDTSEDIMLNRHLAAITLVISWAELITLIGRHPKLLHCNVYVTMFYKVLNSFFFFLAWYSLFIIAFGMGFYIMLHDDSGKHSIGQDDSEKNPYFNRTWLSLVKTSAMFVGELEFSDLPINSDTYLGMLAYAFFITFLFLIVVVLMNLLNGLAVSDTSEIKQKAEIYSYMSRVETISYMESVLLGDPFDFLSNVPTYLSNLPSGSFLRQLYKNACCRKILTKMGAKGFLLFYTYLPNKKISLKPNKNDKCCMLAADEMGKEIIKSAKDIIARQRKEKKDDSQENIFLRNEIQELKDKLSKVDDMAKKIDMILLRK